MPDSKYDEIDFAVKKGNEVSRLLDEEFKDDVMMFNTYPIVVDREELTDYGLNVLLRAFRGRCWEQVTCKEFKEFPDGFVKVNHGNPVPIKEGQIAFIFKFHAHVNYDELTLPEHH